MSDAINVPIGRVAKVQGGYAFKSSDWQESGVAVVKIANVKDGFLDMQGCSFVSASVAREAAASSVNVGDILIGMTGYVGTVARAVSSVLPALINQRVGRFRFLDDNLVDHRYFYRAIRLPETKAEFERLAGGSAQPNLSGPQIEIVEIPLPPIGEQRRIAALLGALDEDAALCRVRLKTLDALGEATFRWHIDSLASAGLTS